MNRSSTGLEENLAGALCYALGWITGLIFLLVEQRSPYVRYHAMQSLLTFGALTVISLLSGLLPGVSAAVGPLLGLLSFVLWILLIIKAWQGERYKLPWVGDEAERRVRGMGPLR